jgi:hypothetical protein
LITLQPVKDEQAGTVCRIRQDGGAAAGFLVG